MIAICCMSAILAGLSILQAYRDGIFAVFVKVQRRHTDAENARPRATRNKNVTNPPKMAHVVDKTPSRSPGGIQNSTTYVPGSRTSLHGYYAKQ